MDASITLLIPSLLYLLLLIFILWFVYNAQKKRKRSMKPVPKAFDNNPLMECKGAMNILEWEFDYIKTTASEAMRDRHTMINFYLIITGIITSGVINLLKKDSGIPVIVGTSLLWILCIMGLFYFLKIIRLRQAWHDSARAMNRIKKSFTLNAGNEKLLKDIFLWDEKSLPDANTRWNVFHYSAMFIGFINSAAYVSGSILLYPVEPGIPRLVSLSITWWYWLCIIIFGLILFCLHDFMYQKFVNPSSPQNSDKQSIISPKSAKRG